MIWPSSVNAWEPLEKVQLVHGVKFQEGERKWDDFSLCDLTDPALCLSQVTADSYSLLRWHWFEDGKQTLNAQSVLKVVGAQVELSFFFPRQFQNLAYQIVRGEPTYLAYSPFLEDPRTVPASLLGDKIMRGAISLDDISFVPIDIEKLEFAEEVVTKMLVPVPLKVDTQSVPSSQLEDMLTHRTRFVTENLPKELSLIAGIDDQAYIPSFSVGWKPQSLTFEMREVVLFKASEFDPHRKEPFSQYVFDKETGVPVYKAGYSISGSLERLVIPLWIRTENKQILPGAVIGLEFSGSKKATLVKTYQSYSF